VNFTQDFSKIYEQVHPHYHSQDQEYDLDMTPHLDINHTMFQLSAALFASPPFALGFTLSWGVFFPATLFKYSCFWGFSRSDWVLVEHWTTASLSIVLKPHASFGKSCSILVPANSSAPRSSARIGVQIRDGPDSLHVDTAELSFWDGEHLKLGEAVIEGGRGCVIIPLSEAPVMNIFATMSVYEAASGEHNGQFYDMIHHRASGFLQLEIHEQLENHESNSALV